MSGGKGIVLQAGTFVTTWFTGKGMAMCSMPSKEKKRSKAGAGKRKKRS
jgi:hypothetical protein